MGRRTAGEKQRSARALAERCRAPGHPAGRARAAMRPGGSRRGRTTRAALLVCALAAVGGASAPASASAAGTLTIEEPVSGSATTDTTPAFRGTTDGSVDFFTHEPNPVTLTIYPEGETSGTPVQTRPTTVTGEEWSGVATTLEPGVYTAVATEPGGLAGELLELFIEPATSNAVTFMIEQAPHVTSQPSDRSVAEGGTAQFKAAGNGEPEPEVQWQVSVDGGVTWKNETGGVGANTNTLTVSDVSPAQNGWEYHAVFTNAAGKATSDAARLEVLTAPEVTADPSDAVANAGSPATFTAAASGRPAPTVQWQVSKDGGASWSNDGDATAKQTTLTINSVSASQNGNRYRAVFTNEVDSATSQSAKLEVRTAPVVTASPQNRGVNEGESVSFSASATGNPAPTVQWQVSTDFGATWENDVSDSGTTTNTLTISSAQLEQSGNEYRAVFSNVVGSTASSAATLTVHEPHVAPAVTSNPSNRSVIAGEPAVFTAAASGNPNPTVQWQVSTDGETWKNDTTDSGTKSTTLVIEAATPGQSGFRYRAVFSNGVGSPATTTAATLTVSPKPEVPHVTKQPSSVERASGETATFSAAAAGVPSPSVQWQVLHPGGSWVADTADPGNQTGELTVLSPTAGQNGNEYRAVFTNASGTVETSAARLTVLTPPAVTLNPVDTTVAEGEDAVFTAAASGVPAPKVQWEYSKNGGATWNKGPTTTELVVPSANESENGWQVRAVFSNTIKGVTQTATTQVATLTVTNPPVVKSSPSDAVVIAGAPVSFKASASGSPAPSEVEWQVRLKGAGEWVNDGDEAVSKATGTLVTSTLQLASTASSQNGNEYRAVFRQPGATTAPAVTAPAHLTVQTPPSITLQPADGAFAEGENAVFTATATGFPTPKVQWETSANEGTSWTPAGTAPSLTISSVKEFQDGLWVRAVFTNAAGSVTTRVATLTVTNLPTVKVAPSDVAVTAGSPASFTAKASGLPAPTEVEWQVRAEGSGKWAADEDAASNKTNGTLVTSTLQLASTTAAQNGNEYRAVFKQPGKGESTVFTEPARLTVNVPPAVTVQPADATVGAGSIPTFSAAASGAPPPSVQWQLSTDAGGSWSPIEGATGNTLALRAASPGDSGHMVRAIFTNVAGSSETRAATLTVSVPAPPGPPSASFTWFPTAPRVGEVVTLASTSTDPSSPITGYAWDPQGGNIFTPGPSVVTTLFTKPGHHIVHLRVTDGNGLSAIATRDVVVGSIRYPLLQPFPIVRITGRDSRVGARISRLTVQAPVGAKVRVSCRGRSCPRKSESRVARSSSNKKAVVLFSFKRFQRSLRAGVVLSIKVYAPGTIGKYTSFRIRRSRLPARVDACLDPQTLKAMTCPAS